jgi:hypothetical protein
MLASNFHTFHTSMNRYGSRKPAPNGRVPYLPYLPHLSLADMRRQARMRVRACAGKSFLSMEGMEVWKKQTGRGFAASTPLPHLMEVWK